MTADFFRFPHTPHIKWLGSGEPRGDKILSELDVKEFLTQKLTVEEKIDGANVGFSVAANGKIQVQNRGTLIQRDAGGQFKHFWRWVNRHEQDMIGLLGDNLILFGEWCYAVHSLKYNSLPDWFIGFDIYDRKVCRFYSMPRRNEIFSLLEITPVHTIGIGHYSMNELIQCLNLPSHYGAKQIEGIYLRQDEQGWLTRRAKLVRRDFIQTIEQHWSKKSVIPNSISK